MQAVNSRRSWLDTLRNQIEFRSNSDRIPIASSTENFVLMKNFVSVRMQKEGRKKDDQTCQTRNILKDFNSRGMRVKNNRESVHCTLCNRIGPTGFRFAER